jgi:hypothetical protein
MSLYWINFAKLDLCFPEFFTVWFRDSISQMRNSREILKLVVKQRPLHCEGRFRTKGAIVHIFYDSFACSLRSTSRAHFFWLLSLQRALGIITEALFGVYTL